MDLKTLNKCELLGVKIKKWPSISLLLYKKHNTLCFWEMLKLQPLSI